jgi:hypothetical protein
MSFGPRLNNTNNNNNFPINDKLLLDDMKAVLNKDES